MCKCDNRNISIVAYFHFVSVFYPVPVHYDTTVPGTAGSVSGLLCASATIEHFSIVVYFISVFSVVH